MTTDSPATFAPLTRQSSSRRRELARALAKAAAMGDHARLVKALDAGANPSERKNRARSVLMAAAVAGHIECVATLIERGADPMATDSFGFNPLMMCAAEGSASSVEAMARWCDLEAGCKRENLTALALSLLAGRLDCAEALWRAGADLRAVSQQGHTAMMSVALCGARRHRLAALEWIVSKGGQEHASWQAMDGEVLRSMHWHVDSEVAEREMELVAKLSPPASVFECLCQAALCGPARATRALARLCDPLQTDRIGRTPLMRAAEVGNVETLQELLPHGGLLLRDEDGHSAWDLAVSRDYQDVAEMIRAAALSRSEREELSSMAHGAKPEPGSTRL